MGGHNSVGGQTLAPIGGARGLNGAGGGPHGAGGGPNGAGGGVGVPVINAPAAAPHTAGRAPNGGGLNPFAAAGGLPKRTKLMAALERSSARSGGARSGSAAARGASASFLRDKGFKPTSALLKELAQQRPLPHSRPLETPQWLEGSAGGGCRGGSGGGSGGGCARGGATSSVGSSAPSSAPKGAVGGGAPHVRAPLNRKRANEPPPEPLRLQAALAKKKRPAAEGGKMLTLGNYFGQG